MGHLLTLRISRMDRRGVRDGQGRRMEERTGEEDEQTGEE